MEIREVEERNVLSIRTTTSVEKIPEAMGAAYGEIAAFVGRKGIAVAGQPFAVYHNMDMQALDIEMGVPVSSKVQGEGRIQSGLLPGGKVATSFHYGPYATISETYDKVMAFAKEKGLTAAEWVYEYYLNSPDEVPENELKTEIFLPIVE